VQFTDVSEVPVTFINRAIALRSPGDIRKQDPTKTKQSRHHSTETFCRAYGCGKTMAEMNTSRCSVSSKTDSTVFPQADENRYNNAAETRYRYLYLKLAT
jgi:hypothetical protein